MDHRQHTPRCLNLSIDAVQRDLLVLAGNRLKQAPIAVVVAKDHMDWPAKATAQPVEHEGCAEVATMEKHGCSSLIGCDQRRFETGNLVMAIREDRNVHDGTPFCDI